MKQNRFELANIGFVKTSAIMSSILLSAAFIGLFLGARVENGVHDRIWIFASPLMASGTTLALVAYWERRLIHRFTKHDMKAFSVQKELKDWQPRDGFDFG